MADRGNLVLIGMPGSGKSTIGRLLADRLGRRFVDTDALVEASRKCSLQTIVDAEGPAGVLAAEETEARALDCRDTVIATGGSMVYSEPAMTALKRLGRILWLDVPLAALQQRVGSGADRGLAMRPDQDLSDLASERLPLYARHADLRIPAPAGASPEDITAVILAQLATTDDSDPG
ncbi:shikimate kinase [Aquisalimonas sp. 2447]|uniref:shikimate kinase n=1 Tax=Aquisalimonas sp. 2447 TaxID=2740807 RepID=UPI00143265AD|nr:shikimate kinase [Aquisalimonas sp. 2447]QIT56685.1 shikimate kinase [Aquisalimonas sp. 2447]